MDFARNVLQARNDFLKGRLKMPDYNISNVNYNTSVFYQINNGMVLISSLLLLLTVTLLATSALQNSLLEVKMGTNFHSRELAFQDAEKKLLTKEQLLKNGKIGDAQIISQAVCGITFYRVFASDRTNIINLQSTVAIVGDTSKCDPKPIIKTGQQSWQVVLAN